MSYEVFLLLLTLQRDCHTVSQRCSKKPITALAALQENKLLLLGHDNGQILLMA